MEIKNNSENISVSIVIVCMNNLKNLYPCLDSIKDNTTLSYEVFVVAYLFSIENLGQLKADYPWVTVVESNEIRGFSENNNLALRQINGEYCFVLNDDTLMEVDVIGSLVGTIKKLPEDIAVVSPNILNFDGTVQYCGRPYYDWKTYLLPSFYEKQRKNEFSDKQGVFKSYNICGAAFLIKTEIFREVDWFDEYYFFAPEDIALSTLLNKKGYRCYVNADVSIIHYGGMTGKSLSYVQTATEPAHKKGSVYLYSDGNKFLLLFLSVFVFCTSLLKMVYHKIKSIGKDKPNNNYLLFVSDKNTLQTILRKNTPKEIFIKFYSKL